MTEENIHLQLYIYFYLQDTYLFTTFALSSQCIQSDDSIYHFYKLLSCSQGQNLYLCGIRRGQQFAPRNNGAKGKGLNSLISPCRPHPSQNPPTPPAPPKSLRQPAFGKTPGDLSARSCFSPESTAEDWRSELLGFRLPVPKQNRGTVPRAELYRRHCWLSQKPEGLFGSQLFINAVL